VIKTVRLAPIERDVGVMFPDTFGPRQRSAEFAAIAQREIKRADDQNRAAVGARVPYDVWVDGAKGVPLSAVKPNGVILAEWMLALDLFKWIDEQLAIHSPVGKATDTRPGHPGLYRRSHVLFADNLEVLPTEQPPPANEYFFVNTQPYARKIERLRGVYQAVAHLAGQRFGRMASVRFNYRSPLIGDIQTWALTTRMQTKAKGNRRNERLTRQPAIVIRLK